MAKTIKLNSIPKTAKYRLQELVDDLPKSFKISDIEAVLAKHGISKHEFWADRKIKFGSKQSIPGDRLQVYANLFDVPIEQLTNQPIKVKPLIQSRIKTPLK